MYKVRLVELQGELKGKWGIGVVGKPNTYKPSLGIGDKITIIKRVRELNVAYYYNKARELFDELVEMFPEEYDTHDGKTMGDLVC